MQKKSMGIQSGFPSVYSHQLADIIEVLQQENRVSPTPCHIGILAHEKKFAQTKVIMETPFTGGTEFQAAAAEVSQLQQLWETAASAIAEPRTHAKV